MIRHGAGTTRVAVELLGLSTVDYRPHWPKSQQRDPKSLGTLLVSETFSVSGQHGWGKLAGAAVNRTSQYRPTTYRRHPMYLDQTTQTTYIPVVTNYHETDST
jgi:hypothetical protein